MRMLLLLTAVAVFNVAFADNHLTWKLNSAASQLSFDSSKNTTIQETHRFRQLTGSVKQSGDIVVQVDLMSVDTRIPIRDQRMREILFKMAPSAQVFATVDMALVTAMAADQKLTLELSGRLSLNGKMSSLPLSVELQRLSDHSLQVSTGGSLDVAEYGYLPGIEALRQIAGLKTISTRVPYQLKLLFDKTEP
ncbi:MAG: YceI family protein [Pseudomonadota bacterium]|nr:YceI family protein [Pseudomonadota bacterium]